MDWLSAAARDALPQTDISVNDLPRGHGTNPFNMGRRINKYRPGDLCFVERGRRTGRTLAFKETLEHLSRRMGVTVPYAFKLANGTPRSLDAGCLGKLYNHDAPEVEFDLDADGFIVAVRLTEAKTHNYKLEWLIEAGAEPAFVALIETADAGALITYGRLAESLRSALGNPIISHHHMGNVVGDLMNRVHAIEPQAPLLNLMLVRADAQEPGDGATPFLRDHYAIRGKLSEVRRRELVRRGLNEVWSYPNWRDLYARLLDTPFPITAPREQDYDRDGQSDNPRYGGEPESAEHRAVKIYVRDNPGCLRLGLTHPRGRVEVRLLSGDAMDVEFVDGPRRIGVEVKSIRSGRLDLLRGIYQCVKYRAVMIAQSGFGPEESQCESILVTERQLPDDLRALARRLNVPLRIVRVN